MIEVIYIFTYMRDDQKTYDSLPASAKKIVSFVICESERRKFRLRYPDNKLIVVPSHMAGIANARQFVVDASENRMVLFLDDDLCFFARDASLKLKKLEGGKGFNSLLKVMSRLLSRKKVAMVGISMRGGNNRVVENYGRAGRICDAYGIDLAKFKREGAKFNEVEIMEDFHVNLHMAERGYKNYIIYKYAQSQAFGRNAPGGCSTARDYDTQERNAIKLSQLHPGCVKVINKTSGGWKGLEKRKDVVISWKKAFNKLNKGLFKFFN